MLPELPGGRSLGRRVRLQVAPGPATSFDLQGEGRAAAQSRALLLGEALPPLRLEFRDSAGNPAGRLPAAAAVALEVLSNPVHTGGAAVQDLRVEGSIRIDEESGNLLVDGLRVVGHPPPSPASTPGDDDAAVRCLSIFRLQPAAGTQGGASQSGAQRDAAAAVGAAEVYLAVHVADMVSQVSAPGGRASVGCFFVAHTPNTHANSHNKTTNNQTGLPPAPPTWRPPLGPPHARPPLRPQARLGRPPAPERLGRRRRLGGGSADAPGRPAVRASDGRRAGG
jgi:hypothetical protein